MSGQASAQPRVLMYSTAVCPYCVRAEQLLRARGVSEIEKIRIDLDPAQRADRFVNDWQRLGRLRETMQQRGDTNGARQVSSRMVDMTKGLERDAQVESLVRGRAHELGVKPELGRDLARDLAASVSMERSRSIGMGL